MSKAMYVFEIKEINAQFCKSMPLVYNFVALFSPLKVNQAKPITKDEFDYPWTMFSIYAITKQCYPGGLRTSFENFRIKMSKSKRAL